LKGKEKEEEGKRKGKEKEKERPEAFNASGLSFCFVRRDSGAM
jgi:hypothetical protein